MSDVNFTPGNWRVVDRSTNEVKGYEICWSDDGECVTDHVYEESDAYVMAAAKELYEALTLARHYVKQAWFRAGDNDTGENEALDRVDDALAKARGEQP